MEKVFGQDSVTNNPPKTLGHPASARGDGSVDQSAALQILGGTLIEFSECPAIAGSCKACLDFALHHSPATHELNSCIAHRESGAIAAGAMELTP
jgi:hypothetical protein